MLCWKNIEWCLTVGAWGNNNIHGYILEWPAFSWAGLDEFTDDKMQERWEGGPVGTSDTGPGFFRGPESLEILRTIFIQRWKNLKNGLI